MTRLEKIALAFERGDGITVEDQDYWQRKTVNWIGLAKKVAPYSELPERVLIARALDSERQDNMFEFCGGGKPGDGNDDEAILRALTDEK